MYNYQNDIFDTFIIPDGVDKNLLIQNLMVQTAELELLYTDPDVLKTVIGFWSAKELSIWEKLKATTEYDYNPIWNTDREITHTDSTTRTRTRTENIGETEEANANSAGTVDSSTSTNDSAESDSDTTSDSSFDGEETTQIAAFNADSMQESQKVTTSNDAEATETNHSESSGSTSGTLESTTTNTNKSDRTNNRKTDEDEGETVTYMHHEEGHGNIGVTTTQQMIREEREVVKFNIMDYIIEEFTHRFCILIY